MPFMLRAGMFRLMFQRVLDFPLSSSGAAVPCHTELQGDLCTGYRSFEPAWGVGPCHTREIYLRCGMRRRHRLRPGSNISQ